MNSVKLIILLFLVQLPLAGQNEKRITILHTNDMHSRLLGFSPETAYTPLTLGDDATVGGFARIAAIIAGESKGKGDVLVLDAGDFTMGTLFPSLELKHGFQLNLMKEMGYDAVCLGNHEYEFGPEWLADMITSARGKGAMPLIMCGNAVFSEKDHGDDKLEKLEAENVLRRKIILEKGGIKIGLFSLLGQNAADVAPKASPVTFGKQVSFASRMVKELRSEKCDLVICVSHSGIKWLEDGGMGGEDVELAKKVKGIDIVIGGHSHTRLDQPLIVNGTAIVQTGEFGKYVGALTVAMSNGKSRIESYRLIPVDDRIAGDSKINDLINNQKAKITDEILKPLGFSYDKPVAETSFILDGNDTQGFIESNIGPLAADAIHYYVNRYSTKGTDISMIAAGVIFDRMLPGVQAAPDIFRVVPLGSGNDNVPGYALSRLYVTGKELKSILEILQVAWKSDPQNYCYYSGISADYDPDKGIFRKIKAVRIVHPDGTTENVDFSKKNPRLYSITANSYMLEFIGIIKKMSLGLVNVVPKDEAGSKVTDMKTAVIDMDEDRDGVQEGKEWLAMLAYLGSMRDLNGNSIPDIDMKYREAVGTFIPVKK